MKKVITLFAAVVMIAGFSNTVLAQVTNSTATGTATIIAPITLSKQINMNFGTLAVKGTAGTVILTPAGIRTLGGGVTLPIVKGTVSAASFTVGGEGTSTYAITLHNGNYTISETGGQTMIINTFTSTPSATGALTGGTQTLTVGATLNVNASQLAGIYTNTTGFDVTVNYN